MTKLKEEDQAQKGKENVFEKFATRTIESVKETFNKTLVSRNIVLSTRVSDDDNEKLITLIDAGIFKSKSECAAFLIDEGIKQQKPLFEKISGKMKLIEKLKKELKEVMEVKGVESKNLAVKEDRK